MLINDNEKCNLVWDRVDKELGFFPDCSKREHSFEGRLPFSINRKYCVFDILCDWAENSHELTRDAFIKCTKPGGKMYALDWQHSAFLYDPRKIEEQQSVHVEDELLGRDYYAYFPDFFPDGDYYFFIDENFNFGYLAHLWREEVWIFGEKLIEEFDKIYSKIGWKKIKEIGA